LQLKETGVPHLRRSAIGAFMRVFDSAMALHRVRDTCGTVSLQPPLRVVPAKAGTQ
jgi:hypothetical protein